MTTCSGFGLVEFEPPNIKSSEMNFALFFSIGTALAASTVPSASSGSSQADPGIGIIPQVRQPGAANSTNTATPMPKKSEGFQNLGGQVIAATVLGFLI